MKKIPSIEQAEVYLVEAQELNPGPWIEHSRYVGKAAKLIAENHPDLDTHIAVVIGTLHDIGRRFGINGIRHSLDGYNFLNSEGFEDAARVCITHSFPTKNVRSFADAGLWDGTNAELGIVESYLDSITFNEYDKLIQLCDALSLPNGFVLIEKRLIDTSLRYPIHAATVPRWRRVFEIQAEIEKAIGGSIYAVLNGVIENTFGFNNER